MQFQFLGTSAGLPTKNRNVTSLVLNRLNTKSWYMVDCGEGTQHQLLHTAYSFNNLKTIFITHMHGDHCLGLPGLLSTASMSNRDEPITLVGPAELEEFVTTSLALTDSHSGFELRFIDQRELMTPMDMGDFEVQAIELSHRIPCFAYAFTEYPKPRLDIDKLKSDGIPAGKAWSILQQGKDTQLEDGQVLKASNYLLQERTPRKLIVCGDNDTPNLLLPAADTATVVVHESTYTQDIADKVGPRPQHCSSKTIASFAETAKIPNLVLTHFSARYNDANSLHEVENEAKEHYKGQLYLAHDFDTFRVDNNGGLQRLFSDTEPQ